MKYMGDKEFWDDKFLSRGDKLLKPEEALVKSIEYFKNGTVLDVACGDGRNTIFLLERGFNVTGIDFSEEALNRLEAFVQDGHYKVSTQCVDLSKDNSLAETGIFDNIIINHYRLSKNNLDEIHKIISRDGILFICGFGNKHKCDDRIRKDDLIDHSDFEGIRENFELISYDETIDERGFFVTYLFKRK